MYILKKSVSLIESALLLVFTKRKTLAKRQEKRNFCFQDFSIFYVLYILKYSFSIFNCFCFSLHTCTTPSCSFEPSGYATRASFNSCTVQIQAYFRANCNISFVSSICSCKFSLQSSFLLALFATRYECLTSLMFAKYRL